MSATGNCCNTAVAESFFSIVEFELLMQSDWHTRDDAKRAVFRYIETWYRRKRRLSACSDDSRAASLQLNAQ